MGIFKSLRFSTRTLNENFTKVEESPSLDFTLPVFNELDNDTKIIILCSRPSYSYWFDHDPSKLLPKEKTKYFILRFNFNISVSRFT